MSAFDAKPSSLVFRAPQARPSIYFMHPRCDRCTFDPCCLQNGEVQRFHRRAGVVQHTPSFTCQLLYLNSLRLNLSSIRHKKFSARR